MTPLYKRVNPIFFQFLLVAGGLWFFHCIAAFIIRTLQHPDSHKFRDNPNLQKVKHKL